MRACIRVDPALCDTPQVLIGHSDSVAGAALAADGSSALTFAFDASVRVWDLASGRCRAVLLPLGNEQVLAARTLLQGPTCFVRVKALRYFSVMLVRRTTTQGAGWCSKQCFLYSHP